MINKEDLKAYLEKGFTYKKIADMLGCSDSTIWYQVKALGLSSYVKRKKRQTIELKKIDTKEKAYSVGFIIGDGYINPKKIVEISIAKRDREVADLISKVIDSDVTVDNTFNPANRRFPRVRTSRVIKDISKFTGGEIKKDRRLPIVSRQLDPYLLRGIFDADGCVSYGYRKDRKRFWIKVSFTSQLKILYGVQQLLINRLGVPSIIHPKSDENCYVLAISNVKFAFMLLDYIYQDQTFIVLKRKYAKYIAARLELEENGEGNLVDNTVPSLQSKKV